MFSAIRASVWSKNNGGGGESPDPFPGSATERSLFSLLKSIFFTRHLEAKRSVVASILQQS